MGGYAVSNERNARQQEAMLAALRREAKAVRSAHIARAISEISAIMELYNIDPRDVPYVRRKLRLRAVVPRGPALIKYRDPITGANWSGRGKRPLWLVEKIKSGARPEDFKLDPPERPD